MDQGYVRLWRKSIDGGLIKNHNVWIFWTWCLMKANHKPDYKQIVGFQEVILQPGDFIFGRKKAAEETALSEQNIRTCLVFLKKCQNLTIKSTNKFSIISIVKWDTYQFIEEATNQQTNQHVTSSQPASNHKQEPLNKRTEEIKDICIKLIQKINLLGNKKFRLTQTNFEFIIPRLKEGFSEEDCNTVITNKHLDPNFSLQYFKPETLFRKSKFEGYLNEDPKQYKIFTQGGQNDKNQKNTTTQNYTKPDTRQSILPERLPDYEASV